MIQQLVFTITQANEAYRNGNPIMSDSEFDSLLEKLSELDPKNPILSNLKHDIQEGSRKRKLPIAMASMNKVKTIGEISDWVRLKQINPNQEVVITPKYDGLSLCVNEKTAEAWTRGDGEFGQKSDEHYKLIENKGNYDNFTFTYGEVVMQKKTFNEKYSSEFANPRNLVAGLLNSKEINKSLKDLVYIKYGALTDQYGLKSEILDELNKSQKVKVPYVVEKIKNVTEDFFQNIFNQWSQDFEIDGLIIEVNSLEVQKEMGRETSSNNPCWARAYKSPNFEQVAETVVTGITWNISKLGYLKPTINVSPIKLDGVTISNVTGNNARFVKEMGLGKGAKVKIKRSGMVIPIIHEVVSKVPFEMPNVTNISWNENGVELITTQETDEQKFKQIVSFFEVLGAENFGEGVIKQLWDSGYTTIKDILNLTKKDLGKIERFGERKSSIVFESIQKCIKNVPLSKLQHASGLFVGLGSKKLALLEGFKEKPTIDQVLEIDGFAEISAKVYVENWDRFFSFIKDLPVSLEKKSETMIVSNDLEGKTFVFTGIRRKDLEDVIMSRGGTIGSSVSKNTTHLIMKSLGSGSSKEKKAQDLGVSIWTVQDLENFLFQN